MEPSSAFWLFNVTAVPTVLYECEEWDLTEIQASDSQVVEMSFFGIQCNCILEKIKQYDRGSGVSSQNEWLSHWHIHRRNVEYLKRCWWSDQCRVFAPEQISNGISRVTGWCCITIRSRWLFPSDHILSRYHTLYIIFRNKYGKIYLVTFERWAEDFCWFPCLDPIKNFNFFFRTFFIRWFCVYVSNEMNS